MIFTTDHGLAFPGAKATLTDRGIGVLLIVRGPGGFTGGKVSDALVSQVDIFPTICDLLGIERPEWVRGGRCCRWRAGGRRGQRRGVCGDHVPRRLRAAARGAHEALQVHPALRQRPRGPVLAEHRRQPQQGLPARPRAGRARRCPSEELYDLVFDPNEAHNIVDDPSREIAAELRARLQALDGGDRRSAARRAGRAGCRARRSTCRPALAVRARRRWCLMPHGLVLQTQADAPAGLLGELGAHARHSRSTSSAPTRDERLPGPARLRTFVVALGSGATAAGGGPAWVEERDRVAARGRRRRRSRSSASASARRRSPPRSAAACTGCRSPRSAGSRSRRVDADRVPSGPWLAWHEDGFTLPPLAYELARNAFGVQAFCHCRHLAVQFHPEVTPAIVARLGGRRPRRPRARGHHARGRSTPAPTARGSRRASRRRSCSTASPPGPGSRR